MKKITFFLGIFSLAFFAFGVHELKTNTVSAQGTSAIIISTQGTLSAGGAYTQSTGSFVRVVEGTPLPSPSPTATPTCTPVPGVPGGTTYFGTYTLSNGANGNFILNVESGTNNSNGVGAPETFPMNPTVVEQGNAVVTLQINTAASTGTGTISFTSSGTAITGTIAIMFGFPYPPTPAQGCGTPTPTPTATPVGSPTPVASPTVAPSPTPSTVTITGRVLTPSGLAINGATVILTDATTNARQTARTSAFGVYSFSGVITGRQYVVSAASKRYRFAPIPRSYDSNVNNLDLMGLE